MAALQLLFHTSTLAKIFSVADPLEIIGTQFERAAFLELKKLYNAALFNTSNEPVDVQPFLDKLSAYTGGNYSGEYGEPDLHTGILLVWDDIIKLVMVVIPPLREIFLGQVASVQDVPGWLNIMSRCFKAQYADDFTSLEDLFRNSLINSSKADQDTLSEVEQIRKANGMVLKRVPEILVVSVESPHLKLPVQGKPPSSVKFPREFDLSDFCQIDNSPNVATTTTWSGFIGSRSALPQSSPRRCYELASLIAFEGPLLDSLSTYFKIGSVEDGRKWYRGSGSSVVGVSDVNAVEDNFLSLSGDKKVHPRLLVYIRKDLHIVLERTILLVSKAGQLKALGDVAFALAMTTENYGEARRCYEEAIALDESLRPPLLDNLNILDKIERTQKARVLEEQADLALANKRFKDCSEMYSRSMICAVKGSNIYVRVREKLEYASRISHLEVACMFAERGEEELKKGNYTTAKDYYSQTTKVQKDIVHLNSLMSSIDKTMQSQTASQKISEAEAAKKAGKYKLSNQLFREAYALVPQKLDQPTLDQLGPLMQAEDALVKHKSALAALDEKTFSTAIVYFTEAISLLPETCISDNAVFLCDRAQAYIESAQYDQAVEDCTKALSMNPDLAIAHFRLGIAYFEMNSYDEAINSYEKALKADSSLNEQVKVKLRQVGSAKEVMERKAREAEREQKKIEEEKAREEKRAKDEAVRKEKAEKAAREKAEKAERQRLKDEERKANALKEKELAEEAKKNKEAEKERLRLEKEERDKQKVVEREQQRIEKERERERQKQEKEAKAALEKKIKEDEIKRREDQIAEMERALKKQKDIQEAKEAEKEKARLERERIVAEREKARLEKAEEAKKSGKPPVKLSSEPTTPTQNSPKVTRPVENFSILETAQSPWSSQNKPSAIMEAAPKSVAAAVSKPDFPVLGDPKPSRIPLSVSNPAAPVSAPKKSDLGEWVKTDSIAVNTTVPLTDSNEFLPLDLPSSALGSNNQSLEPVLGLGSLSSSSFGGFGGLGLGSFLSSPTLSSSEFGGINDRMGGLGLNDPISMALDSLGTSPSSSFGLGLGLGDNLGSRPSGSRLNLGGLGTGNGSFSSSSLGGNQSQQNNLNSLNSLSVNNGLSTNNSMNGLGLNSGGYGLGSLRASSEFADMQLPSTAGIFNSLNRGINVTNSPILSSHSQPVGQPQMINFANGLMGNVSNISNQSSFSNFPQSTEITSRRSLDDNLLPEHAFSSVAWLRQYGISMYRWSGNSSEWTEYALHLPIEIVNSILGPDGSTLNEIQSRSGCKIWLDQDILHGKTTSFLVFQRGASGQPSNACMSNALDLVNLLIRRLLHNNPSLLMPSMLMRSSSDPSSSPSWPSVNGLQNGLQMPNSNANSFGFRSSEYF